MSNNNPTILTWIQDNKGYLYEIGIGILILTISVLVMIYPNISASETKLGSSYTAVNIVWIILVLGFILGIYPYFIRPNLIPDKKPCPACPSTSSINISDIPSIKEVGHMLPTNFALPKFILPTSSENPSFDFDQYARTNEQNTKSLDITIIISKPKSPSEKTLTNPHFSLGEIACYDFIGRKINLDDSKVTVTSENTSNPKGNLFDNDLDTYYYTNSSDPTQSDKLQEIKIFLGVDVGISRIILVNKAQPKDLTGLEIRVIGANKSIDSNAILLADVFIKEDNYIQNMEIDRITGGIKI